jgi:cytoskeletal protein CcmA (bactofilin family)
LRLGTSVVIKGHLTASENLTLHGPFQGEIEVRAHTATIGRLAHIEAPIVAKGVVVEGTVRGNVTATDLIELRDTARLHGNVAAPRIVMADGAWVCGSLETRPAATADSGPPTNPAGEGRSRSNPTGRSVAARKN